MSTIELASDDFLQKNTSEQSKDVAFFGRILRDKMFFIYSFVFL